MKEYKKIYSNELLENGIYGLIDRINNKTKNKFNVNIQKTNNNMYILTLYCNNTCLFINCNTIDCLYSLINGYFKAIYDCIEFNIINLE